MNQRKRERLLSWLGTLAMALGLQTAMVAGFASAANAEPSKPQPGQVFKQSEVDTSPRNGIRVNGTLLQNCDPSKRKVDDHGRKQSTKGVDKTLCFKTVWDQDWTVKYEVRRR